MKKGEIRRQQIVDMAEHLFDQHGYEQTSVQDIIDALDFSKGGFYHHFDSKLALLEAICEERAEATRKATEDAVQACTGDAAEKLNALLDKSTLWQSDSLDYTSLLIRVAYREDGALMRDKLKQRALDSMLPLANAIVGEGVRTQCFFVPQEQLAGELVLRLAAQFTDEAACCMATGRREEEILPQILEKLSLYRHAVERILGAPFGSIVLCQASRMATICRTVLEQRAREERHAAQTVRG